jgi:hypothetical protein
MESDGDHFLAYYLTKDDGPALDFKKTRSEHAPYETSESQEACNMPYQIMYVSHAYHRQHLSISCEIMKQ